MEFFPIHEIITVAIPQVVGWKEWMYTHSKPLQMILTKYITYKDKKL